MRVFLIKHAQSQAEKENKYTGDYEDHLSEEGKKQAKELHKKLVGKDIEKVFVSPRIHCVDTAYILEENCNIEIFTATELAQRRAYGILTGLNKKVAEEKFPDLVEEINSQFPYHKIDGCEDYYLYSQRMLDQFNTIIKDEFEKKTNGIAFITHEDTIKIIFRELIGFEIKGINDCGVFELEFDGDFFEIIDLEEIGKVKPLDI